MPKTDDKKKKERENAIKKLQARNDRETNHERNVRSSV